MCFNQKAVIHILTGSWNFTIGRETLNWSYLVLIGSWIFMIGTVFRPKVELYEIVHIHKFDFNY
jgi:hypothetical protein